MYPSKALLFGYLLFNFFPACAQTHNTPNKLLGHKEFEIGIFGGGGERGSNFIAETIFRVPIPLNTKIGGGFFLSTDEVRGGSHPAILLDLLKFIGRSQKLNINLQLGKGFYERSFSFPGVFGAHYTTKEYRERLFLGNIAYRFFLTKKVSLSLGGFYLSQSYKAYTEGTDGLGQPLNPFYSRGIYSSGGIKAGIVF